MNATPRSGRALFRQVGGTARWVALSSVLGIITIGSGIGLLAFATYLLTRSALLGSAASLSLTILGVRFFALTRVVGRYCERYYGHLGTFRVLTKVRVWFFESLLVSDALVRSSQRGGDIVAGLVDDVETLQDRMLRVSAPPIVACGALLVGISALLAINPLSAAILTTVFVIEAFLLPPLLRSRTRAAAASSVAVRAERLAAATEYIEGLETLAVWGRTDLFTETAHALDAQEALIDKTLTFTQAIVNASIVFLTGLCAIAILAVLRSSNTTSAEIWWLTATPLIALATFEALGPLLAVPEHRARTDASASRLNTMTMPSLHHEFATTNRVDSPQVHLDPAIEVKGLCFSYDGATNVLNNASVTIPYGSTVAIAAQSGSGKSTFLNLLLGFLDCDSGDILIGGISPLQTSLDGTPLLVAVQQDDHVFDTTFRDNLLVGNGDSTESQLLEACEITGLSEFLRQREHGLDTPIGSDGALLSGGERQRLMIARALLANAPILILDEATEHLEAELRSTILTAILLSRSGKTTVILAHDHEAFARADAIYDLVDGTFGLR